MSEMSVEEDLDIEVPKTAVCGTCFTFRAANGTCWCD